jgi:hypothetical protein
MLGIPSTIPQGKPCRTVENKRMSKRTPHKHFNRLIKNKYRHKKES